MGGGPTEAICAGAWLIAQPPHPNPPPQGGRGKNAAPRSTLCSAWVSRPRRSARPKVSFVDHGHLPPTAFVSSVRRGSPDPAGVPDRRSHSLITGCCLGQHSFPRSSSRTKETFGQTTGRGQETRAQHFDHRAGSGDPRPTFRVDRPALLGVARSPAFPNLTNKPQISGSGASVLVAGPSSLVA